MWHTFRERPTRSSVQQKSAERGLVSTRRRIRRQNLRGSTSMCRFHLAREVVMGIFRTAPAAAVGIDEDGDSNEPNVSTVVPDTLAPTSRLLSASNRNVEREPLGYSGDSLLYGVFAPRCPEAIGRRV